jgi:hypothetical protein
MFKMLTALSVVDPAGMVMTTGVPAGVLFALVTSTLKVCGALILMLVVHV